MDSETDQLKIHLTRQLRARTIVRPWAISSEEEAEDLVRAGQQ